MVICFFIKFVSPITITLFMKYLSRQFKQILLITFLLFCLGHIQAQTKATKVSHALKHFGRVAGEANVTFALPDDFKELPGKYESMLFDYGITIPGQEFEIWFRVIPQKESDPDSVYLNIGRNEAKQLAGGSGYFNRTVPERVLTDYNADVGKTYFMNLPDSPETRHYKYVLLITLQKSHKGTIMAAAFTNDKGPDFFRNINKARNCIKFKP